MVYLWFARWGLGCCVVGLPKNSTKMSAVRTAAPAKARGSLEEACLAGGGIVGGFMNH